MKHVLSTLSLILVFLGFSGLAHADYPPVQKIEFPSVECKSSFGNLFCTGKYTCKQAALDEAQAKKCKIEIKNVESNRNEDVMGSGVAYRSYSCVVTAAESDCETDSTSK